MITVWSGKAWGLQEHREGQTAKSRVEGGIQGWLEEEGRVPQVKEAGMMLREMGKSEQSIMACFKFFRPQ